MVSLSSMKPHVFPPNRNMHSRKHRAYGCIYGSALFWQRPTRRVESVKRTLFISRHLLLSLAFPPFFFFCSPPLQTKKPAALNLRDELRGLLPTKLLLVVRRAPLLLINIKVVSGQRNKKTEKKTGSGSTPRQSKFRSPTPYKTSIDGI